MSLWFVQASGYSPIRPSFFAQVVVEAADEDEAMVHAETIVREQMEWGPEPDECAPLTGFFVHGVRAIEPDGPGPLLFFLDPTRWAGRGTWLRGNGRDA